MEEIKLKKRTPKQRLDYIYDKLKEGSDKKEMLHWEYDIALADYLESIGQVDTANKLRDLQENYFWYS